MDKIVAPLSGVLITPIKIIANDSGDILHGLKSTEPSFSTFGEALAQDRKKVGKNTLE